MKKILIINTVGYNYDGITSVILNYLKEMNKEDLSFSFPVYTTVHPKLKEELEALGTLEQIPDRKKSAASYIAQLHRILKNNYDCIHIHGNSGTMLIETVLAKLHGVKNIIIHAHSTSTNHPFINAVLKYPMMLLADVKLACSDLTGKWLYEGQSYTVLKNAINLENYRFDPDMRAKHRDALEIGDAFLIGHVGHFSVQKNHEFLIDTFSVYHSKNPNTKLLLISDGPFFQQIQEKTRQLGLENDVIFAGRRSDTAELYSAMDLLLLPSRWEGLPLTMIEAQANGLTMLVSDVITRDAQCTDPVFFKALTDGPDSWAAEIQKIRTQTFSRAAFPREAIAEKGFDIRQEAETLHNIYLR